MSRQLVPKPGSILLVICRTLSFYFTSFGLILAADPSTLATLKSEVEQRTKTWEFLAKGLEPRIATLLPCDTRVIASIDGVRRASDARLSALQAYFEQAATIAAQAMQRAEESSKDSTTEFLKTELAETAEERAGIETQLSPLSTVAKARRDLAPAESDLRQIAVILDQRTLDVNKQMALEAPRQEGARNLTVIYKDRQAAFKELSAAYADEAAAWRAYYSARLARANAECWAVNPGHGPTRSPLPEQVSPQKGDE